MTKRHVVPTAAFGLDRVKFEVAREIGVPLNEGYNGDMTSRDAGRIGGNIVKMAVEEFERNLSR
jgi:hypothetical protein